MRNLNKGDVVTIDSAPLVASREPTGKFSKGEVLHLTDDGKRMYFAPYGSSPLYVDVSWIRSREVAA